MALNKLKGLGVNVTKVKLSVVEDTGDLCVFEDAINNKFVIIANCKYRFVLDDLVLAFGTDSRFQGTESAWKKNLLTYYAYELRNLYSKGNATKSINVIHFEPVNSLDIKPLTTTRWGQSYPYNSMCPKTRFSLSNKLTGCVATAMSQIMYYHKHPQKGEGHISVLVDGHVKDVDFDSVFLQWDQMKPSYSIYTNAEENISSIAKLMYTNALAVSSVFENTGTSANNLAARTAFVNFWHYHPTCQLLKSDDQNRLVMAIMDNLKRKLPVIISGGSHSFICDGAKGDYLHFNLGWEGAANGYYKINISSKAKSNSDISLIKEVLYNIRPDKSAVTKKRIQLTKLGTLQSFLSEHEMLNLRELSISGPLGGQDIALLRRMSGASDAWNDNTKELFPSSRPWNGSLQVLDIEDAIIVNDEVHPYYCLRADGSYFKEYKKEWIFDKKMDSRQFDRFKKSSMSHGIGYQYSMRDSIFYIDFFTEDNTISPMMFYDCQNLKEIKLPLSTKRIMGKAFGWCNSLRHIRIPYNTVSIESGAFEDCYLLENIFITKIPKETCHNLNPLKVAGRYGDKTNGYHIGLFNKNSALRCKGIVMNGELLESIPYKKIF